jgi:hypothetical protein
LAHELLAKESIFARDSDGFNNDVKTKPMDLFGATKPRVTSDLAGGRGDEVGHGGDAMTVAWSALTRGPTDDDAALLRLLVSPHNRTAQTQKELAEFVATNYNHKDLARFKVRIKFKIFSSQDQLSFSCSFIYFHLLGTVAGGSSLVGSDCMRGCAVGSSRSSVGPAGRL